jgi:hypothetical protein
MKKTALFLMLLVSIVTFSQSVNEYKYVIVPTKFSSLKEKDMYRLNTATKFFLIKYGFTAYLSNDSIPTEIVNNNCIKLYADLEENKSLFATKVKVVLKDCKEKVIYETDFGTSREKNYATAYNEALRSAFKSFDQLNYKYTPKSSLTTETNINTKVANLNPVLVEASAVETEKISTTNLTENTEIFYFAQPTTTGFQVVDSEPKIIMKLYKTSQKNLFIGQKGTVSGVVLSLIHI